MSRDDIAGFESAIDGKKIASQSATAPASRVQSSPSPEDVRPPGDDRTAEQIIDDTPVLKNLGNQGDIRTDAQKDKKSPEYIKGKVGIRQGLINRVGDYRSDADAAYRAAKVLSWIKTSTSAGGGERDHSVITNGKIEGITADGDARHGTEAGLLQDFGKYGFDVLAAHSLDPTDDTQVTVDGTNLNNLDHWLRGVTGSDAATVFRLQMAEAIDKGDLSRINGLITRIPPGASIDDGLLDYNHHDETSYDYDGGALHRAVDAEKNQLDMVKLLVEQGRIDMAKTNASGKSAYAIAEERAETDPVMREVADYLRDKMTTELRQALVNGDEKRRQAD